MANIGCVPYIKPVTISEQMRFLKENMGSHKTPKVASPDPTPTAVTADGQEASAAEQTERRRIQTQYGRQKTILAGDQEQPQGGRTLLGGQ